MNAPTVSADNNERIPGGTNWAEHPPRVSWPGRLTSSRNGQALGADSHKPTPLSRSQDHTVLVHCQVCRSMYLSITSREKVACALGGALTVYVPQQFCGLQLKLEESRRRGRHHCSRHTLCLEMDLICTGGLSEC